jgi:hypothetical protein
MSFFGDLHPSFAGNVVKAMGERQAGLAGAVAHAAPAAGPGRADAGRFLVARLERPAAAAVRAVDRLTPTIVEVVVRAPLAASRLPARASSTGCRTYETLAPRVGGTPARHGGAGADRRLDRPRARPGRHDRARDGRLVGPLRLLRAGRAGDPDGTDRQPDRDAVAARRCCWPAAASATPCCSRSAGRCAPPARASSISPATSALQDRYKVAEIEAAADAVVWCSDEAPGFAPGRPQDSSFVGNIVEAMVAYQEGRLGAGADRARGVDRIIAIGSDGMMAAVERARHGVLARSG